MLHMPHGLGGHGISKRLLDLQANQYQALLLHLSMLNQDLVQSDIQAETQLDSIDGVLMRSCKPIPGARQTLAHLQQHKIPFILLTNGGGVHESDRAMDLSQKLGVPLDESILIQSHTPFAAMAEKEELKNSPVLVVGGAGDNCRRVAEQ